MNGRLRTPAFSVSRGHACPRLFDFVSRLPNLFTNT